MDLMKDVTACVRYQSLWTKQRDDEEDSPENRIIHCCHIQWPLSVRLKRIGIQMGSGYFKCGSNSETDWIRDVCVQVVSHENWVNVLTKRDISRPESIYWLPLGENTNHARIEIRRSGIDNWWPSWNLVNDGFILEGEPLDLMPSDTSTYNELHERIEKRTPLLLEDFSLHGLPEGIKAEKKGTEVRYRTAYLEVGFQLYKTGFSYFSLDDEGLGRTWENLLQIESNLNENSIPQGSFLSGKHGQHARIEGKVRVAGPKISYDFYFPDLHQFYILEWEVSVKGLCLKLTRSAEQPVRALQSCVWSASFDSRRIPVSVMGDVTRIGETGLDTVTPHVVISP